MRCRSRRTKRRPSGSPVPERRSRRSPKRAAIAARFFMHRKCSRWAADASVDPARTAKIQREDVVVVFAVAHAEAALARRDETQARIEPLRGGVAGVHAQQHAAAAQAACLGERLLDQLAPGAAAPEAL